MPYSLVIVMITSGTFKFYHMYPLSVINDEKELVVQPETVLESVLLLGN